MKLRVSPVVKLCRMVASATFCFCAFAGVAPTAGPSPSFSPPTVTTATDIPFPINAVSYGMVSLLLTVDKTGNLQNTQVIRDYPALTSVVRTAVQNWRFAPATKGRKNVPAVLALSVVFNPSNPLRPLAVPAAAVTATPATGGPAYVPPQIVSGTFAPYPINSAAWGAVVLQVNIDATGAVAGVSPVRDLASLTAPSISAVRQWTFHPATLGGQPVAGSLIVAFVFGNNNAK